MEGTERLETVAEGRFLRFVRRGTWEFVQRKNVAGIVGILAITDQGKMLLVEQYRPPLAKRVIEIPAGLVGDVPGQEHESLLTGAQRELLEETGYEAAAMEYLTEGAASAGLSDEVIALVRATGLRKIHDGGGDQSESIQVHEVPVSQVPAWLAARQREGCAVDLKVYAALWFAQRA